MSLKRSGVEKMKEENEVDSFFENTLNNKDLIKKAKRKGNFRITGISLLASLCLLALLLLLKLQLTPYLMHKQIVEKDLYAELYGANTHLGLWTETYKLLGSTAVAPKYKLLNDKLVPLHEVSLNSSEIETTVAGYSYDGNRVMNFFHPSVNYKTYANDLKNLSKVEDGKLIELGISFDRAYSYEDVVSMLPKDVKLQWNWVNIFYEDELKDERASFEESEVFGFSTITKDGKTLKKPEQQFMSTLNDASTKGGKHKKEFKELYTLLKNKNIGIVGVVIVGDKKQLATLENKTYVKASSFGVMTNQY